MADDLQSNLVNYKLQLQQVEAALTTDPSNDDLMKLRKDLQEVIELTEDLIGTQNAAPSQAQAGSSSGMSTNTDNRKWKVGDRCLAVWSEDKQYYEGTIDEILSDGSCTVNFDNYDVIEVTQVAQLRPVGGADQKDDADEEGSKKPKTKKDLLAAQREYKKKKAQKKLQRMKQLEEEKEQDKSKWKDFNAKVFSKTNKGKVKKSIFATSEHANGRVGVGTCGISGRPMTHFQQRDKYKKQI